MNRRHARATRLNAPNSANGTHRLPPACSGAPNLSETESAVPAGAVDAVQPSTVDAVQPSAVGAVPLSEDANQERTVSKKPSCVICQRSELVGAGYAELIKNAVEVVGYTTDGVEGIDLCRKLQPALLITDMDLANIDGLEICRTLRYELPSIKLLLLSDPYNTSRYYAHFLNAGVNTFCLLTSEPQSLLDAIDRALKGQHYFDEKLKHWINVHANSSEDITRSSISKELAVAELIAQLALSGSQLAATNDKKAT